MPDAAPPPTQTLLPRALTLYAIVAVSLTLAAWCLASLADAHLGLPFAWPLFPRGNSLFDLTCYFTRFQHLHHPEFFTWPDFPFTYYPAGVPLYRLLYRLGTDGTLQLYFSLVSVFALAGAAFLALALRRQRIRTSSAINFALVCLATAYPIFFCCERGNLEILIAPGVLVGLWAFWTGKPFLAAVLWGIFGAVKIYPLLFVALFLSTRRYLPLLVTLLTACATTLLSLAYTGPTVRQAYLGLRNGTNTFLQIYAFTREGSSWDHSLFGLIKPLFLDRYPPPTVLSTYLLLTGALMLALFFLRIRKLPLLNQVVLLSTCEVLLPPTSFDYTLLQLYGAFALLVLAAVHAARRSLPAPAITAALLLLAAIFAPFNLLTIGGQSQNGPEKALLLLSLFFVALLRPFPTPNPTWTLHPQARP